EPQHLATVELQKDEAPVELVHLPAKKPYTVTAFQQFKLLLAGWGEIICERGPEAVNLAQEARQLAELEEGYARFLKSYGEDPADPNSLDRLNERGLQRERQVQHRAVLQKSLQALAPQGKSSIQAELRRLDLECCDLRQRRTYLEKWMPDMQEMQKSDQ